MTAISSRSRVGSLMMWLNWLILFAFLCYVSWQSVAAAYGREWDKATYFLLVGCVVTWLIERSR